MRLLHTKKLQLENFEGNRIPHYAILSHRWGSLKEEVSLQDMERNDAADLKGYEKIEMACAVAADDGWEHIWIDTCCIDKTSSAELSEALNSMFRWYQEAQQCYAYLADVPRSNLNGPNDAPSPAFRKSTWFQRGWTLQELIAPSTVIFLDAKWKEIGTKSNLQSIISEVTGIPGHFLLGDDIRHASIAQRMSWASKRETTRVEDLAYCLMGLFGIYMPMLYGEGERAFIRLQEEIMRVSDDHSLFAWRSTEDHGGILATSPAAFIDSGNVISISPFYGTGSHSTISSRGIQLSLPFISNGEDREIAILNCTEIGKESLRLAIHLRDMSLTKEDFAREQSSTLKPIPMENIDPSQHALTSFYIRQWRPTRNRNWEDIDKCVIRLEGVEEQEAALRWINLDPNWEPFNGMMMRSTADFPNGILGRFLVACKDGNSFQILLNKRGRFLSANISTNSETDSQTSQSSIVSDSEKRDQDRIVKVLGNKQYVRIAINRRILLLRGTKYLTGVVDVSYSGIFRGMWLNLIGIVERKMDEKVPMSYLAGRGRQMVIKKPIDSSQALAISKNIDWRMIFSEAADGGHVAILWLLLTSGKVDPDSRYEGGQTVLSLAAKAGHERVVRLLVGYGAKIDPKDNKDDRTPLLWAAKMGHENVVKLLLATGAELESKDNVYGQTPLLWAAEKGHKAVVQLLLANDAKLGSKDSEVGRTALVWAARNGHNMIVKLLLEKGAEIESLDDRGETSLSAAARNGHDAVVRLLVEQNAKLEPKDIIYGQTPLSWAAEQGNEAIVRLLLEAGASFESKDLSGRSPLFWAVASKNEATVRRLLDQGANVECTDLTGQRPLFWAVIKSSEAIILLLLKHGAAVDSRDIYGRTPLFWAARTGPKGVELLLATNQVDVDSKDRYNSTPISVAARMGYRDIVTSLLARNCSLNIEDNFGRGPLWWARKTGNTSIADLLQDEYKKNGIMVPKGASSTATIPVSDDANYVGCDVCFLALWVDDPFRCCKICNLGEFRVCSACFEIGARCLDASHVLAEHIKAEA